MHQSDGKIVLAVKARRLYLVCAKKVETVQSHFVHRRLVHRMSPQEEQRNPLVEAYCYPFRGFSRLGTPAAYAGTFGK
jgi:hypothetical protein